MNNEKALFPVVIANNLCGQGKSKVQKEYVFYFQPFSKKRDELWSVFSSRKKIQPKHIKEIPSFSFSEDNTLVSTNTYPEKEEFAASFAAFQQSDLKKVILAKKRTYTFSKKVDAFSVLEKTKKTYKTDGLYCFIQDRNNGVVGVSPEILFSRDGNTITVDCTGGTAPVGKEEALEQEKIKQEHSIITDFVFDSLKPHCITIKKSNIKIVNKGPVCHLNQKVHAELKHTITDDDLIQLLHPTPAVCGFPQTQAKEFLKHHETFVRGLYAGIIGWRSKESTFFNVALRIALIKDYTITLFAGAGITSDSILEEEEKEIEKKFTVLEEAIFETSTSSK